MSRSRQEKVLILRLWYEPREAADAAPVLRGTVVDVETGEQQSVGGLGEMTAVIQSCLAQLQSQDNGARNL